MSHEEYLDVLRAIDARPGQDFVDLVVRWGILPLGVWTPVMLAARAVDPVSIRSVSG